LASLNARKIDPFRHEPLNMRKIARKIPRYLLKLFDRNGSESPRVHLIPYYAHFDGLLNAQSFEAKMQK
jgi:hypothetical protein